MTKYYIRGEGKDGTSVIYFNIQKRIPKIRFRICSHLSIDTNKWIAANKSVSAWNKFAKSEEGKHIVEKLDQMQQSISTLLSQGRIQSDNDKKLIDDTILAIVNEEAIRKQALLASNKKKQKAAEEKCIIGFYQRFLDEIKTGTARHGNNKTYEKQTIASWESFGKYLFCYCKSSDTFDDISKGYADKFCAYLERTGLMPTTCNKYIICFRKLCNIAAEYGINHNATSLKVWKEREVYEEEKRAEIYLTEEELDAIYKFPLEGTEEQARDLFILGYLCCQRYSDYGFLSQANFQATSAGTPIIKIRQKKTGNTVEVPIIDSRIDELCKKYNYEFPKIAARQINNFILQAMTKVATVCPTLNEEYTTKLTLGERQKEVHYTQLLQRQAAGEKLNYEDRRTLSKMNAYAQLHNGQPLYKRNPQGQVIKFKYELVTTHTARRSGVTNLYKTGLLDSRDIMAISGHQTEKVFEHYIKVSKSEHADRIAAKLSQLYNPVNQNIQHPHHV